MAPKPVKVKIPNLTKDFQTAIDLAMRLPLNPIVTHAFPLHDVATAFKQFRLGQVCKALILPMGVLRNG